jgi:thermitase
MWARAILVSGTLALVASAPAYAAPVYSSRLVLGYAQGVSADRAAQAVERHGGRVLRRLAGVRGAVVQARGGLAADVLLRRLRDDGRFRYAERDYLVATSETPNDPLYASQYALDQPSGADVAAPLAWDRSTACSKIAVLDSGVDKDHPDLRPNLWKNSNEKSGNGKDDDKNGYVDDVYGADILDGKGSGLDANGHGTHVAGIVAATGNNADGVSGICWKASVMSVRFLDAKGRGGTADAVDAIDYAVHEGAKILNCSFGTSSKSSALEDAVEHAKSHGALLVVAAGNDGESIESHPSYPASFTQGNILTVAASTNRDTLASFSNYGSKSVDVAAPGDDILSTIEGGGFGVKSGTSMAAPLVAGAAAMLRQVDSKATYSELRTALRQSVDKPPALNGKVLYGGRLNVRLALDAITR